MTLTAPDERHYPWKHEGVKVKSAQEIVGLTRTNWDVHKLPAAGVWEYEHGDLEYTHPSEYDFVLARSDTKTVLSTVKSRYHPIQNVDQARFVLDVMKKTKATFGGGGELGPRGVWYTLVLPRDVVVPGLEDDVLYASVTVMNFHGGKSFEARMDVWREVCTNGLVAPTDVGNTIKIRHTIKAPERLKEVQRLDHFSGVYFEDFQFAAKQLLESKVTEPILRRTVAKIWPEPEQDAGDKAKARWENRFSEIKGVWLESENIENFRKTRWGAYNAITEWSQWGRTFYGAGSDENMQAALRPQELLVGQTKDISEKAFTALLYK